MTFGLSGLHRKQRLMNLIQPDGTNAPSRRRRELAGLHAALRNAEIVLKLTPELSVTAAALVNRIPREALTPISPASVQSLADEFNCHRDTISDRITRLIKLGLAENRCMDGGRRRCLRDRRGEIVEVYGIDFTPLVERADELARQAAEIRNARIEHTRLRCEISRIRGSMRHLIRHHADPDQRGIWAGLPKRLAHLPLTTLRQVIKVVTELKTALAEQAQTVRCAEPEPNQCGEIDRQYITEQGLSESCNPAMPAENEATCGQDRTQQVQPTCGLEHVTFDMALEVAPNEWRMMMERHGRPSWHSLTSVAYERMRSLDVHPSAWAQAQAALGRAGAALLILLADAQSQERGGPIRSPGGWVRRMSDRAENGTAHLHRTVFGLLHRTEVA